MHKARYLQSDFFLSFFFLFSDSCLFEKIAVLKTYLSSSQEGYTVNIAKWERETQAYQTTCNVSSLVDKRNIFNTYFSLPFFFFYPFSKIIADRIEESSAFWSTLAVGQSQLFASEFIESFVSDSSSLKFYIALKHALQQSI